MDDFESVLLRAHAAAVGALHLRRAARRRDTGVQYILSTSAICAYYVRNLCVLRQRSVRITSAVCEYYVRNLCVVRQQSVGTTSGICA